ncbi:MAG: 16S rRNA (cytosine(1402)-N(4))-methyltransferase RsmH [Rickettsiales bacterium]
MQPYNPHVPVLLNEMIAALAPEAGKRYVDATFGAGGYSRAILEKADCCVIAVDRDPSVIENAKALEAEYPGRFSFVAGEFADLERLLAECGVTDADGVVMDVGVSSMQIDQPERGFSFQCDGPLDMRMSRTGTSAADAVNALPEADLADIIYAYGGERRSRAIAARIVKKRADAPIATTAQLASIVRSCFPRAPRPGEVDNATRTFQAVRIYVNDELGQLESALAAALRVLRPGGKMVAVTFHSLEDRIVKRFMHSSSPPPSASLSPSSPQPEFFMAPLMRGVVVPSDEEIRLNPRARSAKLRAGAKRRAGESLRQS